jgi:hypothetical protein
MSEEVNETLLNIEDEHSSLSRKFGEPTSSQLTKINTLAKKPLSKEEVFVFSSKMVGDTMIYHPWPLSLHKSLLNVFKNDALTGVSFLLDHSWSGSARPKAAYAYGRSFDARIQKGNIENEEWALYGDVYIVRGKEKDGISTDTIIADIEDGTLFDVSIGFGNSLDECSICGNNIWRLSECEHYPGSEYDGQLCYIVAKPPGYLMELSGVFDGAYPSAEILSAAGRFDNAKDMQLITSFTKFEGGMPKIHRAYSNTRGKVSTFAEYANEYGKKLFATGYGKENSNMDTDKMYTQEQVDALVKETVDKAVAEALANAPVAELDSTIEFMPKEKAVEVLGKNYDADTILKLAKEGIAYREEIIQDAIEWGVRSQGNDFPVDAWKQLLSEQGRTIEAIKGFQNGFKKQAESSIPIGRQSDPDSKKNKVENKLPDEAFRA